MSETRRTILKYALVQLPSALLLLIGLVLLRHWVTVPWWLIWVLFGVWVAKDILLFPLVRRAYEPGDASPGSALIGARATAREPLSPDGYVQVRGELWRAELREGAGPVKEGENVRILGLRGLTLVVEATGREEK